MSSTNQLGAVRPPPKPGQVKVYKALYDYMAQRSDELSFKEGDIIYVLDMLSDRNWWKAKIADQIGLIPSNYIEENTETFLNPMHDAAKRGNIEFLKECIGNKVSINGLDKAGNTPLHWAAYGGHQECLDILLSTPNILINVQNKLGDTPLHNGAVKNHAAIVEKLLEKGAQIDILNNDKKSAYDLAIDSKTKSLLQFTVNKEEMLSRHSEYLDDSDSND